MAEPQRGEVWFAHLGPPVGHEVAASRPVVIVKTDETTTPGVTIVVPLTAQLRRRHPRTTVVIPAGEAGLRQDSLALCYNIRVLDTAKLAYRMGGLPTARLEEIGDRLAFLLGL